jgi:hypothetical protein
LLGYAAVAASALLLALPDSGSPWWVYADPDGAYVGSGANILIGNHTSYLDHPGLPTQQAIAVGYGAWQLVDRARGIDGDRTAFVDRRLLDLDGSRWLYRGWAIVLFVGGALLVTHLLGKLLGHWTWGVAGGLLYLATPGVAEIAHRLRPDTFLAALAIAIVYLVVTGFERRGALRYVAAAALFGFAMTWKISIVWAALPIAVAALWHAPEPSWPRDARAFVARSWRQHRVWLVPVAAAWVTLAVLFNRERLPVITNDDQEAVVVNGLALLIGFAVATFVTQRFRIPWAEQIFTPLSSTMLVAFALGVLVPSALVLDDALQAVVAAAQSLSGGRVNQNVDAFADVRLSAFLEFPLLAATIVFALFTASVVVGLRRRTYWPLVLATAVVPMVVVAAARFSFDYYYATAYAFALPGALWVLRGSRPRVTLPAVVVVAVAFVPLLGDLGTEETGLVPDNTAAQQLADDLLEPGEAIISTLDVPIEDTRWQVFVEGFGDHQPDYPYRFVVDSTWQRARDLGLVPTHYANKAGDLPPVGETEQRELGGEQFVLRRLPDAWGPDGRYGLEMVVERPPDP